MAKINKNWMSAFRDWYNEDPPICYLCWKACGVGDEADDNYPFLDNYSYHENCPLS